MNTSCHITSCHIIVDGNPAIIYASRNGSPDKVMPILARFLEKFWQERDSAGEYADTPECLLAQLAVRFGFESCEDDFSNLRVGVNYAADVSFLYQIAMTRSVQIWVPTPDYQANPKLGLAACQPWQLSVSTS
jgi:hypothetical protein